MLQKSWTKRLVGTVLGLSIVVNAGLQKAQASLPKYQNTNDIFLERYEKLVGEPLYNLIRFFINKFGFEVRKNGVTHVYVLDWNVQAIEFVKRCNALMNRVDISLGEGLLNAITSNKNPKEDELKQQEYEMREVNENILDLLKTVNDYPILYKPTENDLPKCVEIRFNENYIID